MPANRADMLAKSPTYGADALVFDLEDSVPLAEKPKARDLAREYIEKHRAGHAIYVRVNALQTGMTADDLDAVVTDGLLGIRLTKAESAAAILDLDRMLAELERKRGLKAGSIGIGPSLESAKRGMVCLRNSLCFAAPVRGGGGDGTGRRFAVGVELSVDRGGR
jgi:citrate lyase subunit beta/citryl-CoA lyase